MYVYVDDILKLESTKKDVLYLLLKLSQVSSPSDVKFKIESNDEETASLTDRFRRIQ